MAKKKKKHYKKKRRHKNKKNKNRRNKKKTKYPPIVKTAPNEIPIWRIPNTTTNIDPDDYTLTTKIDFTKKKPKPKPKFSTKVTKKLVGLIPDGILIKIISFGMRKLVGRIPKKTREAYFDKGTDALAKIVRAASEGAVRGTAGELKFEF